MLHEIQIIDFSKLINIDCNSTVDVFPYAESFETGLGSWTQNTNNRQYGLVFK